MAKLVATLTVCAALVAFYVAIFYVAPERDEPSFHSNPLAQVAVNDAHAKRLGITKAWQVSSAEAAALNRRSAEVASPMPPEYLDGMARICLDDWREAPQYSRYVGIFHGGKKRIWIEMCAGMSAPRTTGKEAIWLPSGIVYDADEDELVSIHEWQLGGSQFRFRNP